MHAGPPAETRDDGATGAGWQRDFRKLWLGQTLSLFGSQITVLALPLTAVLALDATVAELGLLNAARFAPFVVVVLFVGVYVDRRARRPILVRTNVARAVILTIVPVGAALDVLSMELLYIVAFLVGVMTVFFEVAYPSYVPSVVGREDLTRANGRLEASRSAAEVGGPGIGGLLVQSVTAPFALLADAMSFLISAAALSRIGLRDEAPPPATGQPRAWPAIKEGFRLLASDPYLRPITGEAATFNLFEQAFMTVFLVYAVRDLGLSAGEVGIIISIGALGAFAGAASAGASARRLGLGRTIMIGIVVASTVPLAIPFISGGSTVAVLLLAAVFFVWGSALGLYNVHAVSLRQASTPDAILGRVTASYRFVTYGAVPAGALLGGFLGEALGLHQTLTLTAAGLLLSLAWVLRSPVPTLRSMPCVAGTPDLARATSAPGLLGGSAEA